MIFKKKQSWGRKRPLRGHLEGHQRPEDTEWEDHWPVLVWVLALPVPMILCFFPSVMGHRQPQSLSLSLLFPFPECVLAQGPAQPQQYRGVSCWLRPKGRGEIFLTSWSAEPYLNGSPILSLDGKLIHLGRLDGETQRDAWTSFSRSRHPSWGPRHHRAEISSPCSALSKFLTHRQVS